MPIGAPAAWQNVITSEALSGGQALSIGDILRSFPVASLMGAGKEEYVPTVLSVDRPGPPRVFGGGKADGQRPCLGRRGGNSGWWRAPALCEQETVAKTILGLRWPRLPQR